MRRTLVWTAPGGVRSEIAHVELEGGPSRGARNPDRHGARPVRAALRGRRRAARRRGGRRRVPRGRGRRLGLLRPRVLPALQLVPHRPGRPPPRRDAPRDYVMALVDVPSLGVTRSEQRYEPVRPGVGSLPVGRLRSRARGGRGRPPRALPGAGRAAVPGRAGPVIHEVPLERRTLHGHFSPELEPDPRRRPRRLDRVLDAGRGLGPRADPPGRHRPADLRAARSGARRRARPRRALRGARARAAARRSSSGSTRFGSGPTGSRSRAASRPR